MFFQLILLIYYYDTSAFAFIIEAPYFAQVKHFKCTYVKMYVHFVLRFFFETRSEFKDFYIFIDDIVSFVFYNVSTR